MTILLLLVVLLPQLEVIEQVAGFCHDWCFRDLSAASQTNRPSSESRKAAVPSTTSPLAAPPIFKRCETDTPPRTDRFEFESSNSLSLSPTLPATARRPSTRLPQALNCNALNHGTQEGREKERIQESREWWRTCAFIVSFVDSSLLFSFFSPSGREEISGCCRI